MNEEILIKDNHLSEKEMSDLENFLISDKFPYYYNINITPIIKANSFVL